MKRCLLLAAAVFTSIAASFSQDVPAYVPADDLIGWWPFSGSADDVSGNENHGLVMGGVQLTEDRFGEPNSAYLFPGNLAAFIDVSLNESADSLTQGFSVSAWYRTSTNFGDRRVLQIGNTDSGGRGVMLMLTGGGPWTARTHSGYVATMAGRIGAWPTPAQSVKDEWTHLVFTSNFITGQWRVYQNGLLLGSHDKRTTQNNKQTSVKLHRNSF
jgi:hypothetical protein